MPAVPSLALNFRFIAASRLGAQWADGIATPLQVMSGLLGAGFRTLDEIG